MLFTNDLVFIHIPKTGGMSSANYLLRALQGPVYNCHAAADRENARLRRGGLTAITDINRHCTLQQADRHIQRLQGRPVDRMKLLLAVIRHPFTLEYSFYRHLRKPGVIRRRGGEHAWQIELAQGDFKTFVAEAGYHRAGLRQEDYFLLDGAAPENLSLIRFEELEGTLPHLVKPFTRAGKLPEFPHRNSSGAERAQLERLLDEETRALLCHKHAYLFDKGYYSASDWP